MANFGFSEALKLKGQTAIALVGPSVLAVLVFEVVLNGAAMFNHANLRLPQRVDRIVRLFLVTPDMHRVHHSNIPDETNSNYGFNVPWWDRLFGTYVAQPRAGHLGMTVGLDSFRSGRDQHLDRLLLQPLLADQPVPAQEQDNPAPGATADAPQMG